jgi:transcriptional regulator with XRE-family HTH domain
MDAHETSRHTRRRSSSEPWRVFLSHTSDLRDHPTDRSFVAAAEAAVIRAGHAVTDMAYFTARDHAPTDYCERMVADASVYVGIVGLSYGSSVRGRPDRSYTELEYEIATKLGLPRLIFMTSDGTPSLPADAEAADLTERQQVFRRRLLDESGVTVAWINSPGDLEIKLFQALLLLWHSRPNPEYPNNLQRLRGRRSFSQEEMAEATRVRLSTYRSWEKGKSFPRPRNIRALSEKLGVEVHELGFGAESSRQTESESETSTAELDAESQEPLRAVNELVEWLAGASDQPAGTLNARIRSRIRQLASGESGSSRSRSSLTRQHLAQELIAYYGRDELASVDLWPYELRIDGNSLSLSIVTRAAWRTSSVELLNPIAASPTRPAEHCALVSAPPVLTNWDAVLDRAIGRLARAEAGAQRGNGPVMVNKPLYRLLEIELEANSLRAVFTLDWFAHHALSDDLLESELLDALAEREDAQHQAALNLPLRDALLGQAAALTDLRDRLCAGGPVALFAVARSATWSRKADFLIVVSRRSSRVLNQQGRLAVIPKGFHQHLRDARDEVCLGTTVYRELEEELLGRTDLDESTGRGRLGLHPYHVDRLTPATRWLANHDAVTAQCVAFGFNTVSGNYEFACLMCVPDEEFWSLHGGSFLPNWEAADLQTYSTLDTDGLRDLILDGRWTNEGLFALVEGLRRLAVRYPERVQLPEIEVRP